MKYILLTLDQVKAVKGRHGRFSALEPVKTDTEFYMLPADVLKDPEHKEVFEKLSEFKYADIDEVVLIDDKKPDGEKENQVFSLKAISPIKIKDEDLLTEKPVYDKVTKGK